MTTFEAKDFTELEAANEKIEEFKDFVLNRFFMYARMVLKKEYGLKVPGPSYILNNRNLFSTADKIQITSHWSGSTYHYEMPRSFIFDVTADEKEFLRWQELNKKFAVV